jgi:hypothetical protein
LAGDPANLLGHEFRKAEGGQRCSQLSTRGLDETAVAHSVVPNCTDDLVWFTDVLRILRVVVPDDVERAHERLVPGAGSDRWDRNGGCRLPLHKAACPIANSIERTRFPAADGNDREQNDGW